MNSNPAIIIVTYNRTNSLKRLLSSVKQATYSSEEVPLVISIDKTDTYEIYNIVEEFEWKHGSKTIIKHTTHLGLKQHILSCGDLTETYESVIILEDDLMVSPYFYDYATQAKQFYQNEDKIAGISLYNYQVAESCFYPFHAIDDNSDVYFMQVASSWGQLFTKQHWSDFKQWFFINPELTDNIYIPEYLHQWGKHSWKKHFINYLISQNKFFVFPTLSLTTNCEEKGTNSSTKNVFHVPVQSHRKKYNFNSFDQSQNKYDA
ncbi:MAG: hypothetical protein HY062_07130, partial [Bacteroidetes bacterium]|nr:hypothetical protein [Bacteroidota bacterium]